MARPLRCAASLRLAGGPSLFSSGLRPSFRGHRPQNFSESESCQLIVRSRASERRLRYGSATPMRGKSQTCRRALFKILRSMTAKEGSETRRKNEGPVTASQRLAAHRSGRAIAPQSLIGPGSHSQLRRLAAHRSGRAIPETVAH